MSRPHIALSVIALIVLVFGLGDGKSNRLTNSIRHRAIVSVSEDSLPGHVVYQLKRFPNAKYVLVSRYVDIDAQTTLRVDPDTGRVVLLRRFKHHDRVSYKLFIETKSAINGEILDEFTLTVNVIDVNDHSPDITVSTYAADGRSLTVATGQKAAGIAFLLVTDLDHGLNSKIACSLDNQDFKLDELNDEDNDSAQFELMNSKVFDTKQMIEVTLECHDFGQTRKSSSRKLTINVI
ncbi:protocadherin beta-13-like [Tubulanus polymorphus]|uniref:protocadherin beta-13-like n=1 Tax=Tubulanus polymorphus TaxID=672921 RepID=UPI003DA5D415